MSKLLFIIDYSIPQPRDNERKILFEDRLYFYVYNKV